jgi:hypothetical protein
LIYPGVSAVMAMLASADELAVSRPTQPYHAKLLVSAGKNRTVPYFGTYCVLCAMGMTHDIHHVNAIWFLIALISMLTGLFAECLLGFSRMALSKKLK